MYKMKKKKNEGDTALIALPYTIVDTMLRKAVRKKKGGQQMRQTANNWDSNTITWVKKKNTCPFRWTTHPATYSPNPLLHGPFTAVWDS